MTTNDNNENSSKELSKKVRYAFAFGYTGIAIGAFSVLFESIFNMFHLPRPDSLVALIIEIGIGVIIAVIVYRESDRQQKDITKLVRQTKDQQEEISKLVTRIDEILDEQEKSRKEQHDFAINRARSYLASLHSVITSLMKLDIDPNIPEDKEMERQLDFKNAMVTQLDHIVNQSGAILEQYYLQRLTDIIELSRTNPKPSSTDDINLYLDIEYCPGILSQIDDLLKIMPNPPL